MNLSLQEICEDFANDSTILAMDTFRSFYLPTISVIGFIGNILTLCVLLKIKDVFHRLLLFLTLCDLLVPLFCTFLLFLDLLKNGEMNMSEIIPNAVLEAGFAGSSWMTVTISFERFLGICHPMSCPPANRKARYFVLPVLFVICIDFLLSAALLGFFGNLGVLFDFLFYSHILIQYILPAAVMLILNVIIVNSVIKIGSRNFSRRSMLKIQNTAFVLMIVVLVYVLCWAPFYIIDFTFMFLPDFSGCKGAAGHWVDRWVGCNQGF